MSKPEFITSHSKIAFQKELQNQKMQFENLFSKGIVICAWDDPKWIYKGASINFNCLVRSKNDQHRLYHSNGNPISGDVGDLLRCYVTHMISSKASIELLTGRILSFKILYRVLGNSISRWSHVTHSDLLVALTEVTETYRKTTSRYHRANDIKATHKYLRTIKTFCDNDLLYFVDNRSIWSHGLKNPEREREEERLKNINHQGGKYPAGLEEAIGALKAKLTLEKTTDGEDSSDSILINVHTFSFSLGLRSGELARLPVFAYDFDERSNTGIIRNFVEKGADPLAMPIPEIWHTPVKEAYYYLLEKCEPARQRALEIENNGFDFVSKLIESKNTLSPEILNTLHDAGIDSTNLCYLDLICENFDVSRKSFISKSRYGRHSVLLPSTRAIKLYKLLQRISKLLRSDADIHSIFNELDLNLNKKTSIKHLGRIAGLPKGSCMSCSSVAEILRYTRENLWQLREAEVSLGEICIATRELFCLWATEKCLVLKTKKANNAGILVNYASWINQLSTEYASYLSRHYKENCHAENIATGSFSHKISSRSFETILPLSKHLIVFFDDQLNSATKSNGILPRPLFLSDIYNWLSTKGGKASVFQRHNIRDNKLQIYNLTHHQIRHWLTTAMLRSGQSEMLINLWMGRSTQQIRNYDHRTPKERAEYIRSKTMYSSPSPPPDWLGRKVTAMRDKDFTEAEINDYIDSKTAILHFSPWGYCSRDLTIMPCTKGLMCLKGFGDDSGCSNFHIDPTDLAARENIQNTLNNYQTTLYSLEPRYESLKSSFLEELDDNQTLDQHLIHVIKVISGCRAALRAYNETPISSQTETIKVFEAIKHVQK